MSTPYQLDYTQDRNPLVDYAVDNMWGNPELDSQFQIKLARVSGADGLLNDFVYMGKRRYLPKSLTRFHVFTLGGLDTGFWNFGNRGKSWYPVDTWTTAAAFSNRRAVALDIYKGNGSMFPRSEVYIMPCFDGVTLVCLPLNSNFPLPLDKSLYLHCYSSDISTRNIKPADQLKYSFGHVGGIYNVPADFEQVKLNYNTWKAFKMGMVSFFHNGKMKPITSVQPVPGDLIEAAYDPSVELIVSYDYSTMPDYLSTLDSKRKVILFPGFNENPSYYRYYDDCHYYIRNKRNSNGYYYHRNSKDAVRQLTHQDYGMAADYIETLAAQLISEDTTKKTKMTDIQVMVIYHATRWKFEVGPTASRINDLYLLEKPADILGAMTGVDSNIKEWRAAELEKSPSNAVLNGIVQSLTTSSVRDGLGYNGCSVAMSNSPLYMPAITPGDPDFDDIYETPPYTSGLGYKVPPTFVESSTAYEYDKDGLLLRLIGVTNQEWYAPKKDCAYVEWSLGRATSWLDYVISRTDVKLREGFGIRVYKAPWKIDPDWQPLDPVEKEIKVSQDGSNPYPPDGAELKIYKLGQLTEDPNPVPGGGSAMGDWIDITDTDEYRIENGWIVFQFDTVNYIGMVVFDTAHLYNEFYLEHLDNSLSFGITHKWEIGGVQLPMEPGQIDVWMNRHPLIENVDYILDFPNVYITNKMWLVDGPQFIQYRGVGLSRNGLVRTSELGFVADGVLGYNGRYNLRIDRPTKTIVGGRLYLTETLDWAEDIRHGNNVAALNGFPYEVKHIYSANKYVDKYDTYWGHDEAKALDKEISDYLTEHATYKPKEPVNPVYLAQDRYRVYSPFLSLIINHLILGFLDAPVPSGNAVPYSAQLVDDLTREWQWLLKYDPIILDFDLRFFTVHPYNNLEKLTVTQDQLTFISVINEQYLQGKIKIEGHFEVKHV